MYYKLFFATFVSLIFFNWKFKNQWKGMPRVFILLHVIPEAEMKQKVTSLPLHFPGRAKMAEFPDDQAARLCDNW